MIPFNIPAITLTGLLIFYMNNCHIVVPDINKFDHLFSKYSNAYCPDKLLKSVAIIESNLDEAAINEADPSYGLMQIFFTGTNKLYVEGWENASVEKLLEADFNVYIGSQILSWNISKYGFMRGIICYNNWSARKGVIPYKSIIYFLKIYSVYLRL